MLRSKTSMLRSKICLWTIALILVRLKMDRKKDRGKKRARVWSFPSLVLIRKGGKEGTFSWGPHKKAFCAIQKKSRGITKFGCKRLKKTLY